MEILDGKLVSQSVKDSLKTKVSQLLEKGGKRPHLAAILVGNNGASETYVASKVKSCEEVGFTSTLMRLEENIPENELLDCIKKFNDDPDIDGILVQLPLPKHISEQQVIETVSPSKDVDGFHPVNVGKLMIGEADYLPCTPAGIQQLLIRSGVKIDGAEVVVVGRSNIVGKPIANILLQKQKGANATVTICHTGSKDMAFHTKRADILIVAAGKPKAITADMVKEGAVVIDVGVNRIGMTPEGKAKLCGDVDFEGVKEKAGAITPVPGGVGPMTITMLMMNTVKAAKLAASVE